MRQRAAWYGLLGLTWPASMVLAQAAQPATPAQPPPGGGYVTREEYDKLKAQLDSVVKEMADQKKTQAATQSDTDKSLDDLEKAVRDNARQIDSIKPGENKLVIAGDGEFGFTMPSKGTSTFDAGFAPLFLWELDKNILFEGALDISGSTDPDNNSSTAVDVTLANLTFTATDWLYVGGGIFAVPFGNYHPHSDPSWINLLPDDPLAFGDRALGPSSETGLFLGGATPAGSSQIEYNAYVSNGPQLSVGSADTAGTLNFDDFTDLNNNKAVGGRIGFLPISAIDVGYSIQYSQPSPSGFSSNPMALLQAVDAMYVQDIDAIAGQLRVQAEWIWSQIGGGTYDPDGSLGFGPTTVGTNRSNGGYAMIAYRPSMVSNKFVKNLQFVVRYDAVFIPTQFNGGGNEQRWTFGVDYWIKPNVVLKFAYQLDNPELDPNVNIFMFQCGFGL